MSFFAFFIFSIMKNFVADAVTWKRRVSIKGAKGSFRSRVETHLEKFLVELL